MPTLKRISKLDVKLGTKKLPRDLADLQHASYIALSQYVVKGKVKWKAEVRLSVFRALANTDEKLTKLKKKLARVRRERDEAATKLAPLAEQNARLLENNSQLMRNIEEDSRPDRYRRSPKNYHNAAHDHAFKPAQGRPLPGGSAGLEKK